MHDVNPLGITMYLKELDRQAAPKLRPVRSKKEPAPTTSAFIAKVVAVLRRFHLAGLPWRLLRHAMSCGRLPHRSKKLTEAVAGESR
jgi:hypothetical protein